MACVQVWSHPLFVAPRSPAPGPPPATQWHQWGAEPVWALMHHGCKWSLAVAPQHSSPLVLSLSVFPMWATSSCSSALPLPGRTSCFPLLPLLLPFLFPHPCYSYVTLPILSLPHLLFLSFPSFSPLLSLSFPFYLFLFFLLFSQPHLLSENICSALEYVLIDWGVSRSEACSVSLHTWGSLEKKLGCTGGHRRMSCLSAKF